MLLGSGAQRQEAWQAGRGTAGAAVTKRHRCNFVAPFALVFPFFFFFLLAFFFVFLLQLPFMHFSLFCAISVVIRNFNQEFARPPPPPPSGAALTLHLALRRGKHCNYAKLDGRRD